MNKAKELWDKDTAVVCPHLNSAYFEHDPQIFLEGYLEIMTRCDSVYMMKGFESSAGSVAELALAKELGMDVEYEEIYPSPVS